MKSYKKRFFGNKETDAAEREKPCKLSPLVVLHGRRRILLYDCKKILRYEQNEILLLCGKERLLLCGSRLFCSSFTSGEVTVEGRLSSLSFLGEGGEGSL